jgi:hypothetical protein
MTLIIRHATARDPRHYNRIYGVENCQHAPAPKQKQSRQLWLIDASSEKRIKINSEWKPYIYIYGASLLVYIKQMQAASSVFRLSMSLTILGRPISLSSG